MIANTLISGECNDPTIVEQLEQNRENLKILKENTETINTETINNVTDIGVIVYEQTLQKKIDYASYAPKSKKYESFFAWGIYCCGISLILGLLYTFPIILLVYGNKYDDSVCDTSMNLSISSWLKTSGFIEIIGITTYIILHILYLKYYAVLVLGFFQIFNVIWLIVGSVLYFRDCPHVKPNDLNNLMCAAIIIKWIFFIISLFLLKNNKI